MLMTDFADRQDLLCKYAAHQELASVKSVVACCVLSCTSCSRAVAAVMT